MESEVDKKLKEIRESDCDVYEKVRKQQKLMLEIATSIKRNRDEFLKKYKYHL